jgi:hypothetical protein
LGERIDPEFAQRMMDTLVQLETVKEFCIKFETPPPQFNGLENLQKLVVQSSTGLKETKDALNQVQAVIGRSPNLRCLGLNLKRHEDRSIDPQLQLDPFRFTPERGCLPLEHLMIKGGWELRLDSSLWRYLRNLKTLEIGDENASLTQHEEFLPNWDQFWKGMKDNKIHLRRIKVPETSIALLEYMASYRGIEELIVEGPARDKGLSNEMGPIFLTKVFPRHAHSLRVLQLKEHFDSAWCFGPTAAESLRESQRLEKLSVPISKKMTIVSTTLPLLLLSCTPS